MQPAAKPSEPRRIDRQRRQRIIDATLKLVAEHGVRSLSHRRIAAAAGITSSAPYYYFGTIDDLLVEAYTEAIARDRQTLDPLLAALDAGEDPATAIAGFLQERMENVEMSSMSAELWVASRTNDRLRAVANAWDESWQQALAPHLGEDTAGMVVALISGIMWRGVLSDPPLTDDQIVAVLRRGLEGPAAG